MAVGFDAETLQVRGSPVPVHDGVSIYGTGAADYDLSRDGTLLVAGGGEAPGARLVWMTRDGQEQPVGDLPRGEYINTDVSPDGQRVAFARIGDDGPDVWVFDEERGLSRVTTTGRHHSAVFSPDGRQVAYSAMNGKGLETSAADGSGEERRILDLAGEGVLLATDWLATPDAILVSAHGGPSTGNDIGMVRLDGTREIEWLLRTEFFEGGAVVSPSGNWVAYASDRLGEFEVFVARFPEFSESRQVSRGGSTEVFWSKNGEELVYLDADGTGVWAVSIATEPTLRLGTPELVLETEISSTPMGSTVGVAPDGRFVLAVPDREASAGLAILTKHWTEELKESVPVP